MITITHNATDITDYVTPNSFSIVDNRNSTRDTYRFDIEKTPGGFTPELNAEIIVTLDGDRIFAGSIIGFETRIEATPVVIYTVKCLDYTHQADRRLITERFIGDSVDTIIASLATNYAPGFTTNNVKASFTIDRISFNRLKMSECLDKLAKLTGFYWYIDYYKDIHFFPKNSEPAPFNITDTSDNYVFSSLKIRSDLSQLRNVIQVTGGEIPIAARTTEHAGDAETTKFPTHYKFADQPTVTVDGVAQTVGREYLDESGFDCYWSFREKYVRFDDTAIPPAPTNPAITNIEFTGQPLVPLVAVVPDNESIDEFGEYEHSIVERTLDTQDSVINRGLVELDAYSDGLTEASFETTTPGLHSGQIIRINSALHGVNADYVIQSVSFSPYPNDASLSGIWSVALASTATMTLVDALRSLLKEEDLEDDELEVLLAFFRFNDTAAATDSVATPTTTQRPYLLADGSGNVKPGYDPFICNFAVLEP